MHVCVCQVRGYPEIPCNCYNDGTILYAAAAHGYGQLVFFGECAVIHQSHRRSDSSISRFLHYGCQRVVTVTNDTY